MGLHGGKRKQKLGRKQNFPNIAKCVMQIKTFIATESEGVVPSCSDPFGILGLLLGFLSSGFLCLSEYRAVPALPGLLGGGEVKTDEVS